MANSDTRAQQLVADHLKVLTSALAQTEADIAQAVTHVQELNRVKLLRSGAVAALDQALKAIVALPPLPEPEPLEAQLAPEPEPVIDVDTVPADSPPEDLPF